MTDKMREALIDAVMQPSLDEIVKAAIAHGVEDAPNEKNEMRHRRIASMVRALFAERHQAAQSVPVVGDAVAWVAYTSEGGFRGITLDVKEADRLAALGFYVNPLVHISKDYTTAAELATLREKAAMVDELRKDAERLPALEHTLRHLGRELAKLDKYRLCMSYNDSYFGEPAGTVKLVVVELRHCIDEAIAQGKGE